MTNPPQRVVLWSGICRLAAEGIPNNRIAKKLGTIRTMGKAQTAGHAIVARIWNAHDLQPHGVRTFDLSRNKRLVEKFTDVVWVCLNPPDKAMVLCI